MVVPGAVLPDPGHVPAEDPGGALLSSPISGDMFGGDTSGPLDVLQGDDVARVRDLSVAFGSLRAVRAEAPAQVPR